MRADASQPDVRRHVRLKTVDTFLSQFLSDNIPRLNCGLPYNFQVPYSDLFKEHLASPRNAGELTDADADAERTNPVCGDRLRLTLRLRDGRIEAARFLAYGCAPTLACGSALTELIEGRTAEEASRLTRQDIARALDGLPARKQHAAALAIETLRAALDSTSDRQP